MLGQTRIDEFAFILLGAIIFIAILMVTWTTPAELPPNVSPSSITIHLRPNQTYTFKLNISGKITNVRLEANGTIVESISFSKNHFDIPSKFELVDVTILSPNVTGEYDGYIIVKSTGGEKDIPVKVFVEKSIKLSTRTISFEDFSISNFGNEKILASKQDVTISTSYFSKNKVRLIGEIDASMLPKISEAYIDLIVDDKNDLGSLIVRLNDKEIYNKKVGLGETKIPINTSDLSSVNIISIEASPPGIYFWSSSWYHLASVKFVVRFKQSGKSFSFYLDNSEIQNFYSFVLSSLVSSTSPTPTLGIKINNQLVYLGKPPLTALNVTLSKDLLGNSLVLRNNNTISFYLESKGKVSFSNVLFSINKLI